ncbi:heme/hemin ABC transporter substrate-binding protein [Aurantimonas endophytica]|uniref:Iron complex transport system substrate-binding protein n=1 Tax=Aurantimonas endophytica TaxID=1522175 RepID=A0A7W6MR06_9HYPH|nr:ABC transporter substrate-binding protein [Aurantimonas endophytica]MBB4004535.1 iron complex transport system substrate-binding protein [Aurantimonas endophytica]MCO6405371.1 ABC transporter substrate-binding protein [Aurantimonas endophytica]
MRLSAIATAAVLCAFAVPAGAQSAAEPQRVITIGGAITEILYALGEEDRVVAVDTTSLYPPEALAEKPNVGYMRQLSAEGVLSLSPDLILMDEGAGPQQAVELIDAAGVAVQHVLTGYTVEELTEKVRTVATAVGKADAGEAMAAKIDAGFEALADDLAGIEDRKRVLFILSLVDGRINAAGSGTGADAVIRLAGAKNVFGDVEGYKTLSSEAVAALEPDAILMVTRPGLEAVDPLTVPGLAATPAGQAGTVIRMDALHLLGFGPRTPGALRELAAALYPGIMSAEPAHVR